MNINNIMLNKFLYVCCKLTGGVLITLVLCLKVCATNITIEESRQFNEQCLPLVYASYAPMKQNYADKGIDYDHFFKEYMEEMGTVLAVEVYAPLQVWKNNLLIASIDGKTCGFAFYTRIKDNEFYLEFIVVDPEYKRSGIGSTLLHEFVERFNPTRLSLDTREFNKVGKKFYEHHGFVKQSQRKKGHIHYSKTF